MERKQMRNKKRNYSRKDSDLAKQNLAVEKEHRSRDPKPNDPGWYTLDGALSKDVASVVFNKPLGKPIVLADGTGGVKEYNVPGICTLMTYPSIGCCANQHDPFNVAGFNIYTWLRTKISGTRSYDPADLMFYIQVMDSAYSYLAYMTRVYGIARIYSGVNRYVGDAMLAANGVNAQSVRHNLANFRAYINSYITKLSAFIVPKTMKIFEKHWHMYSEIYMDYAIAKSQFYMYVPTMLLRYDESEGNPRLRHVDITGFWDTDHIGFRELNMDSIMECGNTILDALMSSEDCATISGDLLKAYEGDVWKLSPLAEDAACVPIYSEEMLIQIHNSKFTGVFPVDTGNNPTIEILEPYQVVTQNENYAVWDPQFKNQSTVNITDYSAICDIPYDNPSVDDVMIATRNLFAASISATNTVWVRACGSELLLEAIVYTIDGAGVARGTEIMRTGTPNATFVTQCTLDKFKMFPNFAVISGTGDLHITGDLYNTTVLSDQELYNIHNSALISLYGVPLLGQTVVVK